jgi:hypothetical protein
LTVHVGAIRRGYVEQRRASFVDEKQGVGLADGIIVEVDVAFADEVLHASACAKLVSVTTTVSEVFSHAALVLGVEAAVLAATDDRSAAARTVGPPDNAIGAHGDDETPSRVSALQHLEDHFIHVDVSAATMAGRLTQTAERLHHVYVGA